MFVDPILSLQNDATSPGRILGPGSRATAGRGTLTSWIPASTWIWGEKTGYRKKIHIGHTRTLIWKPIWKTYGNQLLVFYNLLYHLWTIRLIWKPKKKGPNSPNTNCFIFMFEVFCFLMYLCFGFPNIALKRSLLYICVYIYTCVIIQVCMYTLHRPGASWKVVTIVDHHNPCFDRIPGSKVELNNCCKWGSAIEKTQ